MNSQTTHIVRDVCNPFPVDAISGNLERITPFRPAIGRLQGALRHGHARTVSVAGTRDGATIRFAVEDDGAGFDPESAPGRQREVLGLVAKGFGNREIARLLGLSVDGVKKHLKTIFATLGVSSRTEAAALALRENLL